MAEPEQPFANPMAWWGPITAAADAHEPPQAMWARIHEYSITHNLAEPPDLFAAVNEIRSRASSLTYAGERLTRASADTPLGRDLIGTQGYVRTDPLAQLAPAWDLRVAYTSVANGETLSGTITLNYHGTLPPTVGQLYADAEVMTAALVDSYNAELTSIDSLQLGAF